MSQEIIEHIRGLEREKGIEENTVVSALEDALLAAYKKTPGAARHAAVELDDEGEFRVFSIEIPGDLERQMWTRLTLRLADGRTFEIPPRPVPGRTTIRARAPVSSSRPRAQRPTGSSSRRARCGRSRDDPKTRSSPQPG